MPLDDKQEDEAVRIVKAVLSEQLSQNHFSDEVLVGLAAGSLARGEVVNVRSHLASCEICRSKADQFRVSVQEFDALGPAVVERVLAGYRRVAARAPLIDVAQAAAGSGAPDAGEPAPVTLEHYRPLSVRSADRRLWLRASWDHETLVIDVETNDPSLKNGFACVEFLSATGAPVEVETEEGRDVKIQIPLDLDPLETPLDPEMYPRAVVAGEWMARVTADSAFALRLSGVAPADKR